MEQYIEEIARGRGTELKSPKKMRHLLHINELNKENRCRPFFFNIGLKKCIRKIVTIPGGSIFKRSTRALGLADNIGIS